MNSLSREEINQKIARNIAAILNEAEKPMLVNLGIGIPTMVSNYITNKYIYLHAENGMIGVGPLATGDEVDYQCINAGRQPVKEIPGCVYVDSAQSFGMIRGGHIDVTVLGAFEVDQDGNVANWIIPNGRQLGVGGAMDLIKGAQKVIIAMTHTNKEQKKLVKECSLPITGFAEADIVVTELGMFYFEDNKIVLKKISKGVTAEEIKKVTGFNFVIAENLDFMLE